MPAMEPVELVGEAVALVPLRPDHAAGLLAAADSEEIFAWLPYDRPSDIGEAEAWIEKAIADQSAGRRLPFTVRGLTAGTILGSTSYWNVDGSAVGLEIGSSWFRRPAWGDGTNLETKLLMMGHAFDTLGLERVSFRTDIKNERSQAALERLGAVKEGVHRHEMQRRDGSWRDSVHYSVLRSEWPEVKQRLTERIRAKRTGSG